MEKQTLINLVRNADVLRVCNTLLLRVTAFKLLIISRLCFAVLRFCYGQNLSFISNGGCYKVFNPYFIVTLCKQN
jgi:hypothetical protein